MNAREEKKRETVLWMIAKEHLDLETLETRRSDSLDFREQAVWCIKTALEAAYEAGRQAELKKIRK